MAERSPQKPADSLAVWRLRTLATTSIATLAIAVLPGTRMPPPPPAPLPERVQVRRAGALAPAVAAVAVRTMQWWWTWLRSILPAIGRTFSSASDTPTLPTVGRPRDGPRLGALVAPSVDHQAATSHA